MSMKRIRLIVLTILSVFCLQIWAEDGGESNNPGRTILFTQRRTIGRTDRPRMPARQCAYGNYDGENLHIEFSDPEGDCMLYVEFPNGFTQTYQFDSTSSSEIEIGYVGESNLTISTSLGNVYEAEISAW